MPIRSFLKWLRLLGLCSLLVSFVAEPCWAKAKARASARRVSCEAKTRAGNERCRERRSVRAAPATVNCLCVSIDGMTSRAAAFATATNGPFRRTQTGTAGWGDYRADKTTASVSDDTLDVTLKTVGTDWQVDMISEMSSTAGVDSFAGEQIFIAIYPDSATEEGDILLDGTGALYVWKAVFVDGNLTLPSTAVTNQFSAGDFTVVGNLATLNQSYTVPLMGAVDSLVVMGTYLGMGGGEVVPSVTSWGLVIVAVLLLGTACVFILRRRHVTT